MPLDKQKTAVVFPGQGSQKPGMGRELADNFPEAREVFQEVDDALDFNLTRLIFDGPEDELTQTQNAQPALMAVSIAAIKVMEKSFALPVSSFAAEAAGHSLGEFTAITACGGLSLPQVAVLLRLRGKAMREAAKGGMVAILKLDLAAAQELVDKAKQAGASGDQLVIANDNAPGQLVASGSESAVEKLLEICREDRVRAIRLPVSAPFHSPLMSSATKIIKAALDDITIGRVSMPIVANVSASCESAPEKIADNLIKQVEGSVKWRETISGMQGRGIAAQIEIGSGNVLTGLAKRMASDWSLVNIQTPSDIEEFANNNNK